MTVSEVSIHAFRGEGDGSDACSQRQRSVSIHAFRGEGDFGSRAVRVRRLSFQSTPSGGKATTRFVKRFTSPSVSIHAFRGEGDSRKCVDARGDRAVSIHAFRGEGDFGSRAVRVRRLSFQSTPSGGKATSSYADLHRFFCVSIHAFRGEGDV